MSFFLCIYDWLELISPDNDRARNAINRSRYLGKDKIYQRSSAVEIKKEINDVSVYIVSYN